MTLAHRLTLWRKRRQIRRIGERINWCKQHVADYQSRAAYGEMLIAECYQRQRRLQGECWALESPSDLIRRNA